MGFHKRYLSESVLIALFKTGGLESVIKAYSADAIITSDPFSTEVTNIVSSYSEHGDRGELLEQLTKKFETC